MPACILLKPPRASSVEPLDVRPLEDVPFLAGHPFRVTEGRESDIPGAAGRLESSVRIFEGIDRRALTGSIRWRLLIGPEKRKGFYGYFVDVGWNMHGKRMSGTGWLTKAAASVERQAQEAGTAAFEAVVGRVAGGMA